MSKAERGKTKVKSPLKKARETYIAQPRESNQINRSNPNLAKSSYQQHKGAQAREH